MNNKYQIHCDCGKVSATLEGNPRVRAHCHCEDCRDLLDVPFHSVTAWNRKQLEVTNGEELLSEYQHPTLKMKRIYCSNCGETLYNTNMLNWRVVSQHLIRKCNNDKLPDELQSDGHFFYERRIIDINDDLPKHD